MPNPVDIMHSALAETLAATIGDSPTNNLQEVKRLAARLVKIEDELKQCEDYIAQAKKEREEIRVKILPQIMFELGIDSVTIDNHHCTLEPLVQATLPKEPEQRQQAIDWLVDNGHGGMIKRQMTVELPKGDALMEDLVKDAVHDAAPNLPVSTAYTVHHSSYTALAKQLVKSGAPIPTDMLGVYIGQIVRVDHGG